MGSLAGTCGIPTEQHRVYVGVECVVGASGDVRPYAIAWPDGRRFAARSCSGAEEWGRWERGNVVRMWRVELAYNVWRELYWERGRFFVRRVDRNGEGRPLGAPWR